MSVWCCHEQTSSPSPRHKAPNDAEAFRFEGSPSGRTIPCGVAALEASVEARGRFEGGRQSSTPPMLVLPVERPIDEIAQGSPDATIGAVNTTVMFSFGSIQK
jgi:hypothetical protein